MAGFKRRTNVTNDEAWVELRKHVMAMDRLIKQLNPKSNFALKKMYTARTEYIQAFDDAFPVVND